MVNLSETQRDRFDPDIRLRGQQYWSEGRVEFIGFYEGSATFDVEGNQFYEVLIGSDTHRKKFKFSCTCPHFEEGNYCKHLWASILAADNLHIINDILTGTRDDSAEQVNQTAKPHGAQVPIAPVPVESWRDSVSKAQNTVRRLEEIRTYRKTTKATRPTRRFGTYAVDVKRSIERGQVFLHLLAQERLKNGQLGVIKPAELDHTKIEFYEEPSEKDFLWDLLGRTEPVIYGFPGYSSKVDHLFIAPGQADSILRKISTLKKLSLIKIIEFRGQRTIEKQYNPYLYNDAIFNFRLKLTKADKFYVLEGELWCAEEENLTQTKGVGRRLDEVIGTIDHFVFFQESMVRSDLSHYQVWSEALKVKPILIAEEELNSFLDFYFVQPQVPPIELPTNLSWTEVNDLFPRTQLIFSLLKDSGKFSILLKFIYNEQPVRFGSGEFIYLLKEKLKIRRQTAVEIETHGKLRDLNPTPSESPELDGYFEAEDFVIAAEKAMSLGWEVLVHDQKIRLGGEFKIDVSSGVDWFDLQAEFQFGEMQLQLPQLIHALRTGQRTVSLGDGTTGILPTSWFQKFSPMIRMAKATDQGLRLNKVQALFLSASLEDHFKLQSDQRFNSLRTLVNDLRELKPAEADEKLRGELRSYQKQGLSWLALMSEQKMGGILADDMGLGKTIQVLALLSKFYMKKQAKGSPPHGPTLVVAPKSLVFNWIAEAEKFAPHLKFLIYSGTSRQGQLKKLSDHHVIVTTYQTLRIDIETFKAIEFEFLILDEAHQVKNPQSQVSMACRLLKAHRKFALTGTPVENSLMDLFSILAIVTPGLISEVQATRWVKESNSETVGKLARALSPFLLRRMKENVLKDLPEKSEQILYCELSTAERKKYDELKAYYWNQLSGTIEQQGLNKSKIQVLEALLRLRQAACHQGLLNSKLANAGSAKFELVLEQLEQVILDGHKALIFSQFTSLLELFCNELRKRNVTFEYLDGQTQNRAERVRNFQENKSCSVFVLSLKAGGVGLNLTAADYVFILDPWWNPAAESQAIDRSHRIGQDRKVFAYKVIAKDTVEEKILALQKKKKELARAIVSADVSLLSSLQMDDLRELFI